MRSKPMLLDRTRSDWIRFLVTLHVLLISVRMPHVYSLDSDDVYELGVGIADITGPAADVGMMGYGKGGQDTSGIHFRLYSRAFIIGKQGNARVVYINCDLAMISTAVKVEVSRQLQEKFGSLYTEENVLISATHTHSGPGGFLQYVLYIMTTQGFNRQNFNIIVSGIVRSVERAHKTLTKGHLWFAEGNINNASINRSPSGYVANSKQERIRYEHDTDKTMQILKFETLDGRPLGVITWFAVHCTSMNNTNRLISGDNKGYASLLFEQNMNPGFMPGKGAFVAAFANANEGDVSPNTRGPKCLNTGMSCEIHTSSCPELRYRSDAVPNGQLEPPKSVVTNEPCVASGPGKDMFESTRIIGKLQYTKAKELFDARESQRKVRGPVHYIHQYIDMSNQPIYNEKGNVVARTCPPAMGYSFAAGTVDGPGAFDFKQGATTSTPFWNLVRDFIRRPSKQLMQCQHPKPILLASGEMRFPYAWQPTIVPLQLLSVGNLKPSSNQEASLLFVGLPAEFTTMAGRRVRTLLQTILDQEMTDSNPAIQTNLLPSGQQKWYRPLSRGDNFFQQTLLKQSPQLTGRHAPWSLDVSSRWSPPLRTRNTVLHRPRRWDEPPTIRLTDQASRPAPAATNSESRPLIDEQSPPPPMQLTNPESSADDVQPSAFNASNQISHEAFSSTTSGPHFTAAPLATSSSHKVIIAGLANSYSSYVTTFEEYQVQRYEAASTLFGAFTLQAYLQQLRQMASLLQRLRAGKPNSQTRSEQSAIRPPNLLSKQLQLKPGVVYDGVKFGTNFGDVLQDVNKSYHIGEHVQVSFRSGHPQNWPAIESTYLTVEMLDQTAKRWKIVATDGSWETRYVWTRSNFVMGESISTITWEIPSNTQSGVYRIRHFGASKSIFQKISPYIGTSSNFQVIV